MKTCMCIYIYIHACVCVIQSIYVCVSFRQRFDDICEKFKYWNGPGPVDFWGFWGSRSLKHWGTQPKLCRDSFHGFLYQKLGKCTLQNMGASTIHQSMVEPMTQSLHKKKLKEPRNKMEYKAKRLQPMANW